MRDLEPTTSSTSKDAFISHSQCMSLPKSRLFSYSCICVDLNYHGYFSQHALHNPNTTSTQSSRHACAGYDHQRVLPSFSTSKYTFIPHSQCVSLLKSRSCAFIYACFDLNCHQYFSQHTLHNPNTSTQNSMHVWT